MKFNPHLNILPPAQKELWPQLSALSPGFVLYGGTAVALRYGHRNSVDFDFFGKKELDPIEFYNRHKIFTGGQILQNEKNTLTVSVPTSAGEVKISVFGGLNMGRVGIPDRCDNGITIASPLDLAVQKLKVIQVRSETKDFLDLDCLLSHEVKLAEALGAAVSLYPGFPVSWALKAMCYFNDGDMANLPNAVRGRLTHAAAHFQKVLPIHKLSDDLE